MSISMIFELDITYTSHVLDVGNVLPFRHFFVT